MKTAVDTLGSHLVGVEENIHGLADRSEEITHNAAQWEKNMENIVNNWKGEEEIVIRSTIHLI